jgi:accessory gene regulator B
MIQRIALNMARGIKKVVPDHPRDEEVLAFSISFLLNTLLIILLSLGISIFTDKLPETATALIAYALLRQMSGGYHLESGLLCIAVSTAGITAISYSNFNELTIILLTGLSIILALIYAPSQLEGTRIPTKYYPVLKIVSAIFISTNLLIMSSVLASCFFIQALTLITLRKEVRET